MGRQTIEAFYAAFARLDADAMAACYAENARFDDEVLSLQGRREIGGMWRMLCEAVQAKGLSVWRLELTGISDHSAVWETRYRFTATRRLVTNTIDADFEFDEAGLILHHQDSFDFWAWSIKALGLPGMLFGWTPWLRSKVRSQAQANLQRFLAKTAG